MKNNITIITGKIRSGKTTYLKKTLSSKENAKGIIQIADGNKRFFVDVESGIRIELTTQSITDDTFNLGKFIFRKSAFTWAKEKLEKSMENGCGTIAIDEYGLLEMSEEGLEPMVSNIIDKIKSNSDQQLYIVIRESLLEKFLLKFNLNEGEVTIEKIIDGISQ